MALGKHCWATDPALPYPIFKVYFESLSYLTDLKLKSSFTGLSDSWGYELGPLSQALGQKAHLP